MQKFLAVCRGAEGRAGGWLSQLLGESFPQLGGVYVERHWHFLCSLPELVIILNWGLLAVVRQSAGQFSPAGPSLLSWTVQWPYHTIMLWQRMLSITCSGATEGRVHSLQFPEEEGSLLGLHHQNECVQWPSQIQGDVEAWEFDAIHTLHPPHTDPVDGCWTSKAFFCQLRATFCSILVIFKHMFDAIVFLLVQSQFRKITFDWWQKTMNVRSEMEKSRSEKHLVSLLLNPLYKSTS